MPLGDPVAGLWLAKPKLDAILDELDAATQPLFAQVHLIESHGPRFSPSRSVFSKDVPDADWEPNHYDDVLRELDEQLADFFFQLGARGLLDKTIVVISSDHASRWQVSKRIPFLMFGAGIKARTIFENTQPIDLAPTLMKLLDQAVPGWMTGRSLIGSPPDPWRPVLAAQLHGHLQDYVTGRWEIAPGTSNHGAWKVSAIVCDRQFVFDLTTGELTEERLPGKFAECPAGTLQKPALFLKSLVTYLRQFGYAPVRPPFLGRTVD